MRAIAAVIVLAACTSAPPPAQPPTGAAAAPPTAARGLSCDSAVVIQAGSEREGIGRENAWIRENYPGATKESQDLITCNGKPADAVNILTANGQKVTIYFDISGWFGK